MFDEKRRIAGGVLFIFRLVGRVLDRFYVLVFLLIISVVRAIVFAELAAGRGARASNRLSVRQLQQIGC